MEQYWIWLSSVKGIGPKRFYQLLSAFEDARAVWDALSGGVPPELSRMVDRGTLKNLQSARDAGYFYRLFDQMERKDIRAVTRLSDDYPPSLTNIFDPPPTLYMRGEAVLDAPRLFAVVGSRHCTRDGQRAAREIARGLAEQGVVIVSGMARGIDSAAHAGALDADGRTVAVLGCGVDVVYPPENGDLMDRILDGGGAVISEYVPGTLPAPGNFPPRNRIISGLCPGTLIVEGAQGSGAMITVRDALDQNRDVFAVPGSIYSPLSAMPNRLIVDGAQPVLSCEEILTYYRWADGPAKQTAAPDTGAFEALEPVEQAVVGPLRSESLSFDELSAATGLGAAELGRLLTLLEIRGIVERQSGNLYRAYL